MAKRLSAVEQAIEMIEAKKLEWEEEDIEITEARLIKIKEKAANTFKVTIEAIDNFGQVPLLSGYPIVTVDEKGKEISDEEYEMQVKTLEKFIEDTDIKNNDTLKRLLA